MRAPGHEPVCAGRDGGRRRVPGQAVQDLDPPGARPIRAGVTAMLRRRAVVSACPWHRAPRRSPTSETPDLNQRLLSFKELQAAGFSRIPLPRLGCLATTESNWRKRGPTETRVRAQSGRPYTEFRGAGDSKCPCSVRVPLSKGSHKGPAERSVDPAKSRRYGHLRHSGSGKSGV